MISIENVSVKYRLIKERPKTFQEYAINYLKGRRFESETLWALRDITLDVRNGESLGVIGHNGAGKSTLLKVVAGVIKPVEGRVNVSGRIAPLIELGTGFDHELTGRENIYLNASILGFSRKDIEERFNRIIEFSELQDFINAPLKNYSSGMVARLGFSIATEVDPDILVIDEVLSVGDAQFNKKSRDKILEFRKKGITILFVSHAMDEIVNLCDRVLWLKHGRMEMIGEPAEVIDVYKSFNV